MKSIKEKKLPRRGEVWIVDYNLKFSDLDPQEQDFTVEKQIAKSRPCVIISNDIHNEFSELVFAVPLTSEDTERPENPLEVLVKADEMNKLSSDSKVLIIFVGCLSKNFRLKRPIGSVKEEVIEKITKKLAKLIGFNSQLENSVA